MKTFDLKGSWMGKCTLGEKTFNYDASVPGSTVKDLSDAGRLPRDIFYRDNADALVAYESADYEYKRSFNFKKEDGWRYTLALHKVDTYCEILLNGKTVGKTDNAFICHYFDITDILENGENSITLSFSSPIEAVRGHRNLPAAFTNERLHTRRIQCTYGWDWVARFIGCGIQDAVIECRKADEIIIDGAYIFTKSYDEESADMVLDLTFGENSGSGIVNISLLSPNGIVVNSFKRYCNEKFVRIHLDIPEPQLWYPHGYGDQPIYTLLITDSEGEELIREIFGIRIVKVEKIKDKEGSEYRKRAQKIKNEWYDQNDESSGFILKINGKRILAMGANYVPPDPFYNGCPNERVTKTLELAKRSGVNMIRVWGGGDFGSQHFYNECSRPGITVTQDFLMACGTYPEDEEYFINHLRAEARYAAIKLRNKPCLVWWSGDNENAVRGKDTDENYTGRRSAYFGIAKELDRLDYDRLFLPSSPYGGNTYASNTVGTTHNTQYLGCLILPYLVKGDATDYKEFFHKTRARFIAEEPQLGAISETSLRRFMTEEDIYGDDLSEWNYHTKNNPGLKTSIFDTELIFARALLGDFKDGRDRYFKLRYLQYEWIRVTLEQLRREAWFSSGIIYWMLNDCWPAASGWSIIDYYAMPKDALYAFKRCSSDLVLSFDKEETEISLFASGKGTDIKNADICIYLLKNGELSLIKETSATVTDGPSVIFTYGDELKDGEVLIAEAKAGELYDRAFYKNGALHLKETSGVTFKDSGDSITVRSDTYVHVTEIIGDAELEDNCFSLLPGEERTVKIIRRGQGELRLMTYTLDL